MIPGVGYYGDEPFDQHQLQTEEGQGAGDTHQLYQVHTGLERTTFVNFSAILGYGCCERWYINGTQCI